jgi:hypothetical protein
MRILFISTVFLAFFSAAKAQFPEDIRASLREKPKFFFNLTGYTSFISGNWATFSGARFGLNYNNTIKLELGISNLRSSVVVPLQIQEGDLKYSTNGSLHFTYAEVCMQYIFYKDEAWEISLPVSIGAGSAHYNYISRSNAGLASSISYTAWVIQPAVAAQYTVLKWVGTNASLGYLASLHSSPFNSVTFSIGFSLFLDEIWKDAVQKK